MLEDDIVFTHNNLASRLILVRDGNVVANSRLALLGLLSGVCQSSVLARLEVRLEEEYFHSSYPVALSDGTGLSPSRCCRDLFW